jgi:hypothetical protein
MVQMLQNRTQPLFIHKVRTHINIPGNEHADKLAKDGNKLSHRDPHIDYERAHPTPYYLHKDNWPSMDDTPYKGPIQHLQPYLLKYGTQEYLQTLAASFPNIAKWTTDTNIDIPTSTNFWTHPDVTNSQKTCLLKFRYNQYMGNARKQLFFTPTLYPSITCPICPSLDPDTWKHLLLSCTHPHIHALYIKRHNKAVWEIRKLLISSHSSRSYILMNAGTFNDNPPDNTVPPWLLPYSCRPQRCHCLAKLKPDILCVPGLSYHSPPPSQPDPILTIQFIEFTFCNDHFSLDAIALKTTKYQPLVNIIQSHGWQVTPIIVLTAEARATTHIPSIKHLHTTFKIPGSCIKQTFSNINIIAIHHAMSILLHKRRIENNQSIPYPIVPR